MQILTAMTDNAIVCNHGDGYKSYGGGGAISERNVIASNSGSGIVGDYVDKSIHRNNRIVGNHTRDDHLYDYGGGIMHDGVEGYYYGNVIVGNLAETYGGGV